MKTVKFIVRASVDNETGRISRYTKIKKHYYSVMFSSEERDRLVDEEVYDTLLAGEYEVSKDTISITAINENRTIWIRDLVNYVPEMALSADEVFEN